MKHTHGYLKSAPQPDFFDRNRVAAAQRCRVCGCTETTACRTSDGPCHWTEHNLCSGCNDKGAV